MAIEDETPSANFERNYVKPRNKFSKPRTVPIPRQIPEAPNADPELLPLATRAKRSVSSVAEAVREKTKEKMRDFLESARTGISQTAPGLILNRMLAARGRVGGAKGFRPPGRRTRLRNR